MTVINFVIALALIAASWWLIVRLLERSLATSGKRTASRLIPDNRMRPGFDPTAIPVNSARLTGAYSRKDSE